MLHSVIETIPVYNEWFRVWQIVKRKVGGFFITKSILHLIFFPQKHLQNLEKWCKKPFYLSGEQDVHW